MRLRRTLLLIAGVVAAAGCGNAYCGGATYVSPVIRVTDAVTGQPLCDATVIATTSGAGSDAGVLLLGPTAPSPDCAWSEPTAMMGTFTLVVTKTGYKPGTASATWYLIGCNSSDPVPQPQQIDVRLTPG